MWYSPSFFFGRLVPKNESKNISPKLNGLCVRHRRTKHVFSFNFHSIQTRFFFCYIEINCEGIFWHWWWRFTGKLFCLITTSHTQLQSPQLSYFCDKIFVQLLNCSSKPNYCFIPIFNLMIHFFCFILYIIFLFLEGSFQKTNRKTSRQNWMDYV